jgi:PKD repeat protein
MMRKTIITLALLGILLFNTVAPIGAVALTTITDKSQYYVGDNLTVTASGGNANGIVLVQISLSSTVVWAIQDVFTAGGGYTKTLKIPSTWSVGSYTLRVKDDTASVSVSATFDIITSTPPFSPPPNSPPTAAISGPSEGKINVALSFIGTGSDPDGFVASYAWSFGDGGTATGSSVSHTYVTLGSYTITLRVIDDKGAEGTTTATIIVKANQAPIASPGSSREVFEGKTVDFSGSGSSDPDGTISAYEWTFGDGGSATGASVSHSYTVAGTYTVTLKVTDNNGATGTGTLTVEVIKLPAPVAAEVDTRITGPVTRQVIDNIAETGVRITVNATSPVTVSTIRYEENPHKDAALPPDCPGVFVDISVSNPDAISWPMKVELHYTDAEAAGKDETKFGIFWWDGAAWVRVRNTWVDPATNTVYALLDRDEAGGSQLTIGKVQAAAAYTYSGLTVTPSSVNVGSPVTVSVTVKNTGDLEGTTTVDLLVNSVKEQGKTVTLAGGASQTVTFTVTKTVAGSYTVKVGSLTGSFTVVKPLTPAAFTFSGLVVSPADVAPGAEVTVSVSVKNTGEQSGTYSAELKLDGATKETKTGTLAGGASSTVTFKVSSQAEGTHTVQVGTLTGSFKVTKPVTPPPPAPDYTWWIVGGVVVVLAVVAVYYLFLRKK